MPRGKDRDHKLRESFLREQARSGKRTYESGDLLRGAGSPRMPVFRKLAPQVARLAAVLPMRSPDFKPVLLDRFLVAASRDGLEAAWLVNKSDLLLPEDEPVFEEYRQLYESLEVPVLKVSARTGEGLAEVRDFLCEKPTLLVGQSGVGKSTLLNALAGEPLQKTGDMSSASGKGRHTTVQPSRFQLPGGLDVWDLPGIKNLKIWDVGRHDLKHHFPELAALSCRFNDCLHQGEAGCGLPEALASGAVHPNRVRSYLGLLEEAHAL